MDEATQKFFTTQQNSMTVKINTSNNEKFEEFKVFFGNCGYKLQRTKLDLDEILSSPEEVVQNKATEAGEEVLIDDTSLDIENESVGVEVRWVIERLNEFIGKRAVLKVLLGMRRNDFVYIYEGSVHGTLVPARGNRVGKFGIDPYFLPDSSLYTLAEIKDSCKQDTKFIPRYLAVEQYCKNDFKFVKPLLKSSSWEGSWQTSS
jgi:XTP/dITP diphosphohydrolase